jgi:hypothetical protein
VAATDAEVRTRVVAAYAKYHENLATLFKRYNVSFANGDRVSAATRSLRRESMH